MLRDRVRRLRRAGRQLQKTMCQGNRVEYRAAEGEGPVPERAWKGEKYPGRGVKQSLKPCAYNPSEPFCGVTACLSKNESASQWHVASITRVGYA